MGLSEQASNIVIEVRVALPSHLGEGLSSYDMTGGKMTKAEADYRGAEDLATSCGTCDNYQNRTCDIVAGKIDPTDTCDHWEKPDGPDTEDDSAAD